MNLDVDRVTIRLAGHSAADGRRLAALVGDGLAAAAATNAMRGAGAVSTTMAERPGEPLEATASRSVDAITGLLSRSL